MKHLVKRLLLPKGRKLRRLRGGLAKGMSMEIDLACQFQRYMGLDERELLGHFRRLIPSCRSCVDVGANDGYYTIAFLKSSAERVVACEPGEISGQLLENALANGYRPNERFVVERRLVGSGNEMLSAADLVQGLPRPVILKVDVDGGEFDLLNSAETCPFLSELFWVIETHSEELETRCINWLRSHGYRTTAVLRASWRILLPERRPLPHNRWLIAEPSGIIGGAGVT
ncbi:MAG TPA: hypothetical protein VFG95_10690 [Nitrospiria bacterium]|nr:hypothetical protein [Nitrospiria bacterium]